MKIQAVTPVGVFKSISAELTPPEVLSQVLADNDGYIGGTIRNGSADGSTDGSDYQGASEKFSFGTMTFDIDRAKKICGGVANDEVDVDNTWSFKINVDKVAAMDSKSTNPVLIASVPTEKGLLPLLIDGHHRLYKAEQDGKETLPAYVLTPEETLLILECSPDLMTRLTQNLRDMDLNKAQPGSSDVHVPSTDNQVPAQPAAPSIQKPGVDYAYPENNMGVKLAPRYKSAKALALKAQALVRKDLAIDVADALAEIAQLNSDEELDEKTAGKWASRAMAVFQLAQSAEDEDERFQLIDWGDDLFHEALEHAALVKDRGKTVAEVQTLVEEYREKVTKTDAYVGLEAFKAAMGGLVTLPQGVEVKNCTNCVYVRDNRCNNSHMMLELKSGADRMCCNHWYTNGVEYEGLVEPELSKADMPPVERAPEDNSVGAVAMELAKDAIEKSTHRSVVKICKADNKKQIVYGVVLEPDSVDLQGDMMSADDIEETAHDYMENARKIKSRHRGGDLKANPVESYIAPQDFMLGSEHVKKGSWVLGVKVKDPQEWSKVESGEYTGFSVGGVGTRQEL